MAKSITALVIIAIITSGAVAGAFFHTKNVTEAYITPLEEAYLTPHTDRLKTLSDRWNDDKKTLMLIINHRDIEAVSTALLRAYEEAAAQRYDMAAEEISVAKFLLGELLEREKLNFENIF